jgi:hypothetical protein
MKGDRTALYECYLLETEKFKVNTGKCAKSSGKEVKVIYNAGNVKDISTCQRHCNFYGDLCKGF